MANRTADPGPGDQQKGETAPAFQAFRTYLEMGPNRSLAKASQRLGKSKTLLDRWSRRWSWVERCRAWEALAVTVADEAHLDAIAARSRRQAEIAQLHGEATALVAREVVRRVANAGQGEDPFSDVDTDELLRIEASMARAHNRVVTTERLALGLTTEQPGEPVEREQARELARRLTETELEARLTGVDELAEARRRRRRERKAGTG